MNLFPGNDELIAFGKANNYGNQYNDILLAYLRDLFSEPNKSLPDLWARYRDSAFTELFIPSQLFSDSELGAWYDLSDLSTLFQDDAGTVPVTEEGQKVGYVTDKSGNGHHITQSTEANKPVYNVDSDGVSCVVFDASASQYLTNGTIDLSTLQQATISFGVKTTSNAAAGIPFSHTGSFQAAGGLECLSPSAANTTNLIGSRSTAGATNYVGLVKNNAAPYKFVVTSYIDYAQAAGSEVVGIWQGEDMAQNAGLTQENTGNFGNGTFVVGGRAPSGTVNYTGNIYSIIYRGGVSTSNERSLMNTYINSRTKAY